MEKQFVSYELALKLKELGFDEECLGFFRTPTNRLVYGFELQNTPEHCLKISAPLWQQAFDWFRINHKLESLIQRMPPEVYGKGNGNVKTYMAYIWAEKLNPRGQTPLYFDTYEEARLELLKRLVKIVVKENE